MKKLLFNDKFRLTQAVLEGRKTMTRRSIPKKLLECIELYAHGNEEELRHRLLANSSYQVGEVVAIAQSYNKIGLSPSMYCEVPNEYGGTRDGSFDELAGWENKMFVKADLMPHHIKITNIRVERLQDISDEDCLREGVFECEDDYRRTYGIDHYEEFVHGWLYNTPREAFAALIDKVSGRGTWDSNPLVWVYEFELVD